MIPPTLPLRHDHIPAELQTLPQWVSWQWRERGDKWTKPPVNPYTAQLADVSNPASWGTFDTAIAAMEHSHFPGIGFMLTADDPYVAIDLDLCRDAQTGYVASWAQAIIDRFDSYTEISPSGTGVRIMLRGVLPPGRNRRGSIETYDQGRYITITGHVIDGRTAIRNRQAELSRWHAETFSAETITETRDTPARRTVSTQDEQTILARARNARGFDALYQGDLSAHSNNHSAADLAFCNVLVHVGASAEQVDSLMRSSGLFREKWERSDYRERTIDKAFDRAKPSAMPSTNGPRERGSSPDELAIALARIRQLETESAELRAENAELRKTVDTLRMRVTMADEELKIWNNHELGPARATACAVLKHLRTTPATKPDADLSHQVYLAELARLSGQSTDTVSKHLSTLATLETDDGVPVLRKSVATIQSCVNVDTGELVPMHRELWLGTDDVGTMAATLAVITPDKPQWGGKRECPRCGSEHRKTICADCGLVFSESQPEPQDAAMDLRPLEPHLADSLKTFPQERGERLKPHLARLEEMAAWKPRSEDAGNDQWTH